jgi:hypothetical protein
MCPKLVLHIGHGKTGTSFLQSLLSLNTETLKSNGIHYPEHPSLNAARQGRISSGNGSLILTKDFELDPNLTTLLSNENLFHDLAIDDNLNRLVLDRNCHLEVICYTRNVFEMLISTWGQMVKRGGYTKSFEEYLSSRDPHHQKLLWWLDAADKYGFKLTIRNYSNYKTTIADRFFRDIFGNDDVSFIPVKPLNEIVNRSLTLTEYEIQRMSNLYIANSSQFISDVLVNELPLIKAENPRISRELYESISNRMAPIIARLNERIHSSEAVVLEAPESLVDEGFAPVQYLLSKEQIAVLFNSICSKINRSNMSLKDSDAEYLRDIALKIYKQSDLSKSDALQLMELAGRARPHGAFIKEKILTWGGEAFSQRTDDSSKKN